MEQRLIRRILQIDGMTCTGCEMRIENALKKLEGVIEVKAVFINSNVYITYNANVIKLDQIIQTIEKLDYKVKNKSGNAYVPKTSVKEESGDRTEVNRLLGIGIILLAFFFIVGSTGFSFIPEINQTMGYGVLFLAGLMTSLHCITMCGGINLSQCVSYKEDDDKHGKFSKLNPSLLYNSGRVLSYTIIGGIAGALGSVVSFSGAAKGIVAIICGVFMVIMGLNMLNIFPWLRKLSPRMPSKLFGKKINNGSYRYGPFFVGLLNGFMPCGPLQAMQLYALGTGNFMTGSLSMFMFGLGTVPLMFGLGAISSALSGKFTHKMVKISAVLVIVLGIVMANRGLVLSGLSFPSVPFTANNTPNNTQSSQSGNIATVKNGIQIVKTKLEPGRYEPIIVQKGIPVKWTIQAQKSDINGCNNEIVIPKFNKSKKLEPGDNVIEFIPTETGTFTYSCWMGMIRSRITVVDDINNIDPSGSSGERKSEYRIPFDEIAVAKITDGKQYVEINMEENRFLPSVVVMQRGLETTWIINGIVLNDSNSILIFPSYNAKINMFRGENKLLLVPDKDFDFGTADGAFFGYVKVVDDIKKIELDEIKNEVSRYIPILRQTDYSGFPSCH